MECDLNSSVPDWLIDHPESARVFNAVGIEPECAGKSLEYVCRTKGLDPAEVLERLRQAIEEGRQ